MPLDQVEGVGKGSRFGIEQTDPRAAICEVEFC